MTIHDEILRLRDVVRVVSDELRIDEARKIADKELARPTARWQGLTDDDRKDIQQRLTGTSFAERFFMAMNEAEYELRRKNGF